MKKTSSFSKISLAGCLMMASTTASNAVISLTQVGTSDSWDINLTPITFTTTGTGSLAWIVFEDFFATPSSAQGTWVSGTVELEISGTTTSYTPRFANGTFNQTLGGIDANDLLINIASSAPSTSIGTPVTLSTSGVRFRSGDVPAPATGPVDVIIYANGASGAPQTAPVSVAIPEPSSAILLSCFGLALLGRRKR